MAGGEGGRARTRWICATRSQAAGEKVARPRRRRRLLRREVVGVGVGDVRRACHRRPRWRRRASTRRRRPTRVPGPPAARLRSRSRSGARRSSRPPPRTPLVVPELVSAPMRPPTARPGERRRRDDGGELPGELTATRRAVTAVRMTGLNTDRCLQSTSSSHRCRARPRYPSGNANSSARSRLIEATSAAQVPAGDLVPMTGRTWAGQCQRGRGDLRRGPSEPRVGGLEGVSESAACSQVRSSHGPTDPRPAIRSVPSPV